MSAAGAIGNVQGHVGKWARLWTALQGAERHANPWRSPQTRGTATALAVARSGKHRGQPTRRQWLSLTRRHIGTNPLMPNPSFNRTRYGKRRKPGPRHMVHHRVPGLRRLPPRAG